MKNKDSEIALHNLSEERNAAVLYKTLAEVEQNPQIREVFLRMAQVEQRHADTWAEELAKLNLSIPPFHQSWRTRVLSWIARRFGTPTVLPSIIGIENTASRTYDKQSTNQAMKSEEQSHARLLSQMTHATPGGMSGGTVAQLEGRHRASGGNALRAAVLGANDGLVSILSLVMGVAGAQLSNRTILITGLSGLLAGASSMALGEWLSVQSSRELYSHQIDIETKEVAAHPEEEAEELALIYQARGVEKEQAEQISRKIMQDPSSAVETLVREELAIDQEQLGGSAWEAAITSFLLFALGAIIPISPFIFLHGLLAVLISIALSIVGLFTIGAGITLFTGRSVFVSGSRMVIFGMIAAALTFGIGRLIGGNVGG
jgi:vacuolar iron transporter family protein